MDITTNTIYTPSSFNSNNCVEFHIPIYQRLFVWEEEQVNGLLEDLYNAFQSNRDKHYYIGIMTAVRKSRDEDDIEIWEIVDGQQRLTFLALLATQLLNETKQWQNFILCPNSRLRMNYIGRNIDMGYLKKLSGLDVKTQAFNLHMERFVECFTVFKQKYHNDETWQAFSSFVYEKTTFLISWLEEQYTPGELNSYFEKLNSTGRQLEPEDIVKGRYFSGNASEWNSLIDFSKRWEKSSSQEEIKSSTVLDLLESKDLTDQELREPEHEVKPKSAVRSILSVPVFLLHVLNLTCPEKKISLNQRRLIEIFKNSLNDRVIDFIENMKKYRQWMDENIIHYTEDGLDFWNETPEGDSPKKFLCQFQSMLTVSSGENQEWVLDAYKECSKTGRRDLDLNTLKYLDSLRHPVPHSLDDMMYPTVNRYWFWKLDYILWEKFVMDADFFKKEYNVDVTGTEKEAIKNYCFRQNRSIEHLHPQHSPDNCWADKDLHSFGNLAMISSSFNSAQSDDGFGTKLGRLNDQLTSKNLESIKMLLMFNLAKKQENGWDHHVVKTHADAMYSLLKGALPK